MRNCLREIINLEIVRKKRKNSSLRQNARQQEQTHTSFWVSITCCCSFRRADSISACCRRPSADNTASDVITPDDLLLLDGVSTDGSLVVVFWMISPQSEILTLAHGVPDFVPYDSNVFSTFMPALILPNTTCLLSSHGVTAVVMKNCDDCVFGPAFAMDNNPACVCLSLKFSSLKVFP